MNKRAHEGQREKAIIRGPEDGRMQLAEMQLYACMRPGAERGGGSFYKGFLATGGQSARLNFRPCAVLRSLMN